MINLVLVEDEQLVLTLLTEYFSKQPDIRILFTARDGESFLNQLYNSDFSPDVVCMDLKLPGMDGTATIEKMSSISKGIKVIILTSHYKLSFTGFILKSGANAFLPKSIDPKDLYQVIQKVHQHGHYFSLEQVRTVGNQLNKKLPKPTTHFDEKLTQRETEILELICQQHTTQEIADKLFISVKTVEGHRSNLLLKTGARNSAGLVAYAVQKGLIRPDDLFIS